MVILAFLYLKKGEMNDRDEAFTFYLSFAIIFYEYFLL